MVSLGGQVMIRKVKDCVERIEEDLESEAGGEECQRAGGCTVIRAELRENGRSEVYDRPARRRMSS